jgi:hypothetical protein
MTPIRRPSFHIRDLANPPTLAIVTGPGEMRAFQAYGAGVFYSSDFSQSHTPFLIHLKRL